MNFCSVLPVTVLAASLLLSGCNGDEKKVKHDTLQPNTPTSSTAQSEIKGKNDFTQALTQYRQYAIAECDQFITLTEQFIKALKAGEIEQAKALYAPARVHYERIEPIAESLENLDPDIDARENDVEEKEWRGFHRIEKALWYVEWKQEEEQQKKDSAAKSQKKQQYKIEQQRLLEDVKFVYADRLLTDAKLLRTKIQTIELDASLLITGAIELLNEVSTSKVTEEEERYSHTDLYDFAANVEGAQKIYELLQPNLEQVDAMLSRNINDKFKAMNDELSPFKKGTGYVSYTELTKEQVKKLSQCLDALAEPLAQMGKLLGVK